jgi:hypothetical protein
MMASIINARVPSIPTMNVRQQGYFIAAASCAYAPTPEPSFCDGLRTPQRKFCAISDSDV